MTSVSELESEVARLKALAANNGVEDKVSLKAVQLTIPVTLYLEMDDAFARRLVNSENLASQVMEKVDITGIDWNEHMKGAILGLKDGELEFAKPLYVEKRTRITVRDISNCSPEKAEQIREQIAKEAALKAAFQPVRTQIQENGPPRGYVAAYLSNEGRVKHLVKQSESTAYGETFGGYSYSLCGDASGRTQATSLRGEDRNCRKCERTAAARR